MSRYTNISWDNVEYTVGSDVSGVDFSLREDWYNRPASKWAMRCIGLLQSKIEGFTCRIYRANRYGKHNISRMIPAHIIIQFANEAFGYNGWSTEVLDLAIAESPVDKDDEDLDKKLHTVSAHAVIKLTLKDGTNTEATGFGKASLLNKGDAYAKAKKEAINNALKKCLTSFENIIIQYEEDVANNFYTDGLYGSRMNG
ncbi:HCL239Wp [Eremothecium sinecaudum]|uniref:DNA repair protein RAD59 n=1 Tax=Eremothecium sinecaudum TaxID=45286 RepID=A0A0X8HR45_9SACH|nr:HCL239Wp [Eremothecium sinecaudum]AMD19912.1 HCL239Wp [Eremothecium sinecaudum]